MDTAKISGCKSVSFTPTSPNPHTTDLIVECNDGSANANNAPENAVKLINMKDGVGLLVISKPTDVTADKSGIWHPVCDYGDFKKDEANLVC